MRTIAIIGATDGIAQEIIKRIPKDDYVIASRCDLKRLKTHYGNRPNIARFAFDTSGDVVIAETVEKIYAIYGRIDIFINNAGYGGFSDFDTYTTAQIRDIFDVNIFVTITFSRLVGQKMKEAGEGHTINIASIADLIVSAKSSVYSAIKFAVIGFSDTLRSELADSNVHVTTVNPGPVATKFFDKTDPSGDYPKSVGRFVLQPEYVTKRTVTIFGKNKCELNMPWSLTAAYKAYTLFPRIIDFPARKIFSYK